MLQPRDISSKSRLIRCLSPTYHLLAFTSIIYLVLVHATSTSHYDVYSKNEKLALSNHLLRFRRQASNLSQNVNANQQAGSGSSGSPETSAQPGASPDAGSNLEEKPAEEVLSSLKCDFGSSDSPDLCKFKILDNENPLTKGLTTWSLGNGRLALFQGGPLIDASQGNDTNGGYIFYETSNRFASNIQSSNQTSAHNRHQPYGNNEAYGGSDYSSTTTSFSKPHSGRNNQHHEPVLVALDGQNFQQVASARVSVNSNLPGPTFISPNLTAPGPSGMCLSFQYAIHGLSAEELRVFVSNQKTERSRQIWVSSESAAGNWTRGEVLYSMTDQHSLMFSATSGSSPALKDLQHRNFRGYIAIDEIEINKHDPQAEGACRGHCNFDGDLCGWNNAENGVEDDFDWSFGRGSDNLFTGPARDFTSSSNNEITGSFLYIDSGYPRRPGDRAVLISPLMQPTAVNDAMCMRVAAHMFGSGIGSLAIKIRYTDESSAPPANLAPGADGPGAVSTQANSGQQPPVVSSNSRPSDETKQMDLVIWEMSGDAGNSWHQAQTSVSSSKSPFQVLIEGVIGENHLGNIAIDEISFSSGPCPTSPPVASKNYGDCTFEQSMCYWRNPDADIHLDDLDWIRSADEQSIHGPNFDHTLKKRSGSYLKLENTFREPKSGTRAFLLSPIFQPKTSGSVQCLSFYYYMFMRSISPSGPNLGTIRVYLASNNELVPIWRLTNPISSPSWKHGRASLSTTMVEGQPMAPTKLFQIAFEGIWGDAVGGAIALDDITVFDGACDIMPAEARSVPGECTFDVDLCSWSNKTYDVMLAPGATDSGRSPFLESVSSASGGGHYQGRLMGMSMGSRRIGWQLATVDSRPVNLQDHTYKAPIGYTYVDVLDGGGQQVAFPLQSAEVTVQSGQQITLCLSFWFAAFGRQDNNVLNVYLTQASAPPVPAEEGSGSGSNQGGTRSSNPASGSAGSSGSAQGSLGSSGGGANANGSGGVQGTGLPASASLSSAETDEASSGAWRTIDGKLLWSISLRNVTEMNRRKWLYGQVTLKADSNHIVRFVAISNDGGFALDDISYFDGSCETRPAQAKVQIAEDDAPEQPSGAGQPAGTPKSA